MSSTNINQYMAKFKADQKITLDACSKVVNTTALNMYKKVIDRTPVGNPNLWHPPYWPDGYVPGTLKDSWKISFNDKEISNNISGSGIHLQINKDSKQFINISNDQPYAQRVEDGWSTQAPAGMLRITIAEFTDIIDSNATKYRVR